MLQSALFANNNLLAPIAEDATGERISPTRNRKHPAVELVQRALLIWNPACLPNHGADGDYGGETAGAVLRFKNEVIAAPPPLLNDLGPLIVIWLDAIAFAHEQNQSLTARVAEIDAWLTPGLSGVFSSVCANDVTVHTSGA